MKQYLLSFVFIAACFQSFAAINHGSIMGKGLPLYPLRDGAAPGAVVTGVTFDFKVVTVGTKTWVWTNLNGKSVASNDWSSQFRFRYPVKQECNLLNRVYGTQQTYGVTGIPDAYPCNAAANADYTVTFVQQINTNFYETPDIIYNYTRPNPTKADFTPPMQDYPAIISKTDRKLRISLSATDNSGNFFYYIEDAVNGITEISFSNEAVLNIEPGKHYQFTVSAIDFSGNQSEALPVSHLPENIKSGSDFYIIYMDAESEASLGAKVKEKSMFHSYNIPNESLTAATRAGANAWGLTTAEWMAFDVAKPAQNSTPNGGVIVADLSKFENIPNLKNITDNPNEYYFHFAIKSPSSQPNATWTLQLYCNNNTDKLQYYVGLKSDTINATWLGNYAHNDEWQHFEIPVSELVSKGYIWNGPLNDANGKSYLLGFQDPGNATGTELNLDAVFFYKTQSSTYRLNSLTSEDLINTGKAKGISFKLDSRLPDELTIECVADNPVSDAFVHLELNGVAVTGQWKPAIADPVNGTTKYLITVPSTEVAGWVKDAILSLNLGYKPVGGVYVTDNKIITEGDNRGKPILHKIGTGIPTSNLPDSILNGHNFYIISMDATSEAALGTKVVEKNMLRDYDIWPSGNTLTGGNRIGVNAWGVSVSSPWVALDVAPAANDVGWNGGAIVADLSMFETIPSLKDITDNSDEYYFHFAIKSPSSQPNATWTLFLFYNNSKNNAVQYYVGPQTDNTATKGVTWLGNYAHNDEWQHFEIPVSELILKGYKWNELLSDTEGRVYLLGFQDPRNIAGTELNLDAIFFYKKPFGMVTPAPGPVFMNEGTAKGISFKLNSRSLNELKIECTSNYSISEAFVRIELNGTTVAGQWSPAIADPVNGTKQYQITVPSDKIAGWTKDALLGLNLGYKPVDGIYITDNKVITEGANSGMYILHKIGDGVLDDDEYPELTLPDSIKNGSDFYIISMDATSEAALGTKVKEKSMFCDYDIWPDGKTLTGGNRSGINAWGVSVSSPWVALNVTSEATNTGWNGGAIVADLNKFANIPNLKDITDNPHDYYFHFAIKSPSSQPDATWTLLFFYNNKVNMVQYYVGPKNNMLDIPWLGDYAHNDEWQHFEIPVYDMFEKGYKWDGPLSDADKRSYLLGFQAPDNVAGTELNLDAVFFYKKPNRTEPNVLINEGRAGDISFKLDSRSPNELKIAGIVSYYSIREAFVRLELNGTAVAGQWQAAIDDRINGTKQYMITVPATEVAGWKNGAILGLNLGYTMINGNTVTDNKIITSGEHSGKPILHKIGTGVDVQPELSASFLPDTIKNGSDFYLISMDKQSETILGTKVKEQSMLRGYDIWNSSLSSAYSTGTNAWGISVINPWTAFKINQGHEWNGGAIYATLNEFTTIPNLTDITNNPDDYYFHFAIKSPIALPDVGWALIFYSDNTAGDNGLKYYIGPETDAAARGLPWLGNYIHDGKWNHFEIPVSELVSRGYKWTGPQTAAKQYLLGFMSPASKEKTELHLDAMFFYKKPAGYKKPTPAALAPVFNEGTANRINFRLDSRSLNELTILCTSSTPVGEAFVQLELNNVKVTGQWQPVIDPVKGATVYQLAIPYTEISGWEKDKVIGLNFGYKPVGGTYVTDNKILTAGSYSGKPILHKIGSGVDLTQNSNLPDSIKTGSDFYIISIDPNNEERLGNQVRETTLFNDYDIWNGNMTGSSIVNTGKNAWGGNVATPWIALKVTNNAWSGGALVSVPATLKRYPDLRAVTDNPDDYYFHLAVKSNASQATAGWTLIFYSDLTAGDAGFKYYLGYNNNAIRGLSWIGDYDHNGEWHHFEIPVSDLVAKGYKWERPMTDARNYLLGFEAPANKTGMELHLDALFFYKKPATATPAPPHPIAPVFTEGLANHIHFQLDSRQLLDDGLKINCVTPISVTDAYVNLELNGIKIAGWWETENIVSGTNNTTYSIHIPYHDVPEWKRDDILRLNFGYAARNFTMDDNSVLTEGNYAGMPILHKLGTGPEEALLTMPDSILNGSDFHIIYMDSECEEILGAKVTYPTLFRNYDIWDIGTTGIYLKTMESLSNTGINSWNMATTRPWIGLRVLEHGTQSWNGAALIGLIEEYETTPNIKEITDNPNDYYLHFAVKSPSTEPESAWKLIFYSQNDEATPQYYIGPQIIDPNATDVTWLGNYAHNDKWHHFEIPVSDLVAKGYKWNEPFTTLKQYLLGISNIDNSQSEINLDAIFFYKKPSLLEK
jgi:hypothetical protein